MKKYLLLALLVAVFYSNSLGNGFVHDDTWQIESNPKIRSLDNFFGIFGGCIAEELLGRCSGIGFYYRPLQSVAYMFTYQFSSAAAAFHLANLIYYFIVCCLIFKLFELLKVSSKMALIGSIIFLVHPINSEVVNWVSATPELFMAIFSLLTMIFYLKYSETKRLGFLTASGISFLMALLSKETAIVLLLVLPIHKFLYYRHSGKQSASRIDSGQARMTIGTNINFLATYLVPLAGYLILRTQVLGRVVYKYEGYYNLDLGQQILNAIALYPKYLLKLIWPIPLNFQALYEPVRTFDQSVIFGMVAISLTVATIYYLQKQKKRLALFGTLLVILPLLPALVFANKLGEFMFSERYLFISTIGFALLVVTLIELLFSSSPPRIGVRGKLRRGSSSEGDLINWIPSFEGMTTSKKLLKNCLLIAFTIYIGASFFIVFNRNPDWKDNMASYQSMLKVDPNHKNANFQLALIYQNQGKLESASEYFKKIISIDPNYKDVSKTLAFITNEYKSDKGFSFHYPNGWKVVTDKGLQLKNDKGDFTVEFNLDQLQKGQTAEGYVDSDKAQYGTLQNQGLAEIPNFKKAFVKVWKQAEVNKLEFFLFTDTKVVKVLVYPADSPEMKDFDRMLGSLRLE